MSANQSMDQRRQAVLMPNYAPQPIHLERGRGCRVWDADGRSYLDLMGGIATALLGHCHPAVVAALEDQAHRLWHASNHFITGPHPICSASAPVPWYRAVRWCVLQCCDD